MCLCMPFNHRNNHNKMAYTWYSRTIHLGTKDPAPIVFDSGANVELSIIVPPVLTDEHLQKIEQIILRGKDSIRELYIQPEECIAPLFTFGTTINWYRFGTVVRDLNLGQIDFFSEENYVLSLKDQWTLLTASVSAFNSVQFVIGKFTYQLYIGTAREIDGLVLMLGTKQLPVDIIRSLRSYLMDGTEYYSYEDDA